jgi:hypothetical protein
VPVDVRKTKWGASVWVPIVLIIGLVAGLGFLFLPSPVQHPFGRPPPEFETFENFGLLLSTLNLALLVALVVIYSRMYSHTEASFALGLVLVLGALFAETFAGSPLLFRLFSIPPSGQTPFLLIAETFKAVALTVFLYLTLQ